jgi:hypothetical protein
MILDIKVVKKKYYEQRKFVENLFFHQMPLHQMPIRRKIDLDFEDEFMLVENVSHFPTFRNKKIRFISHVSEDHKDID